MVSGPVISLIRLGRSFEERGFAALAVDGHSRLHLPERKPGDGRSDLRPRWVGLADF
jgi:hypothetical protein